MLELVSGSQIMLAYLRWDLGPTSVLRAMCLVTRVHVRMFLWKKAARRPTGQHPFGGQTEFCPNGFGGGGGG